MKIAKDALDIYEFDNFYEQLKQELQKDAVLIDLENVNKIDMSIIQLLVSTKKSCDIQTKNFALENVNQEVTAIFESCACDFLLGGNND